MASFAGTALLWPGSLLDKLWLLNEPAYKQLSEAGHLIGAAFLFLGVMLIAAAAGWFRRHLWGWKLAVAIIAIQVAGDCVNFARGDFLRGGTGLMIALALLYYLLRPGVRAAFR